MTNLPNLSNRAKKALEVLADGGRFVHRLERNSYTGREQFAYLRANRTDRKDAERMSHERDG